MLWPKGHTSSHFLVLHTPDKQPAYRVESDMAEVISEQ